MTTTPSEFAGPVPGVTLAEQATRLAGLLAEQGITTLRLEVTHAPARDLAARHTDLPGLIARTITHGPPARLRCQHLDLTIDLLPTGLRWRTPRPDTATLFAPPA